MKTVKAWEALKEWQENGRKCRPAGWKRGFEEPNEWLEFVSTEEFELEPPKPQVVEFEETQAISKYHWDSKRYSVEFWATKEMAEKLDGRRWKVTCTVLPE